MFCCLFVFFFFKQKTAYEMRISDWSSDVCSSDLKGDGRARFRKAVVCRQWLAGDRRDPALDRGDGGCHHEPSSGLARAAGKQGLMLVLASGSAARTALLTAAGVAHDVMVAQVDEDSAKQAFRERGLQPRDMADGLAELKAVRS